jgi:uncharacterized protein
MQPSCGSVCRSETTPICDAGPCAAHRQNPPLNPSPNPNLVYDLRCGSRDSNAFYAEASKLADEIVPRIEDHAGPILDNFCHHLRTHSEEPPRSRGEYVIEFLTLGMVLRRYEEAAQATSKWMIQLAQCLILLRRHVPILKAPADWLRARLSHPFFLPSIHGSPECDPLTQSDVEQPGLGSPLARLSRLIRWLRATGEYEQEALRLSNWRNYLASLTPEDARHCMNLALESFDDFACEAASRLGIFTEGVIRFLAGEYARRGCREDQIFCGRPPVEYHLNMLAADVMNRGLQDSFDRTTRKVVLVPACMRGAKAATCKARIHGVDITCMACDPDCAVNRITQRMRKLGAKVYLVPHSSGFSRWLDRWEREPGVGVTAVACMLNILSGGYDMRSRRIASQCLPLDYPGCKKHWNERGLPTAVNEDRLVQIIARARR